MHVTHKTMHRFSTMHGSPQLASELRLQILTFFMYQTCFIHVMVLKHDVPCIVRSEALMGHSDTSVLSAPRDTSTDWSLWSLHASDLINHDTTCLNP